MMAKKSEEPDKYAKVFKLLSDITKKTQDNSCVFRGESIKFQQVSSKLWRFNNKELKANVCDLEKRIYSDAKKHFADNQATLSVLAELQHMGGHTNLIDFTENIFMALYFACDSKKYQEYDGRVIICRKPEGDDAFSDD